MVEIVVRSLINHLPLRDDHQEDWVVYDALAHALPYLSADTLQGLRAKASLALKDEKVESKLAKMALVRIIG